MSEVLNLYQKLAKIRAISDAAKKDLKGYGYKYTSLATILAKVTAGMKKYNVSLVPQIVPGTGRVVQNVIVNTKTDKVGNTYENKSTEMLFTADMLYIWVNDDNPDETISVPWFVSGAQSDPSQAIGSGMSYTLRQFLTNYFQIAQTDDDVDAYRSKQKEAEASEDIAIAEQITSRIDVLVKSYLADNPDDKDRVVKFISRYVKGANYLKIQNSDLAGKLLKDFMREFNVNLVEEE